MFRRFLSDIRGNYMVLTAISMVPIMGGLAIAIDYTELSSRRVATIAALDAAGIATARYIASGSVSTSDPTAYDTAIKQYAKDFFEANLAYVDPADTELTVLLPNNNFGGGTLKLTADMTYHPRFLPAAAALINRVSSTPDVHITAEAEIRLKNTLEVALVLDNSGSMKEYGVGTSKKRIDLLKEASKELVNTLAKQASQMKQVSKPVQFALVPFSASVNVGPQNDGKSWMDTEGISPIHHENFDWSQMTKDKPNLLGDRFAKKVGDAWYKEGAGWGDTENRPLTRFSLFQDMTVESDRERVAGSRHYVCYKKKKNSDQCEDGGYEYDYTYTYTQFASWQGCVEARPYPYNTNDTTPTSGTPATLFVPMFAPDEPKHLWRDLDHNDQTLELNGTGFGYSNNWWADWADTGALDRQRDARKYFRVKPYGSANPGSGYGPSFSCTTEPITPLQDVTTVAGKQVIVDAIDDMKPTGNTNVPEGTAWGWRVLSSNEPFTEGRGNDEKGNDKVVIVLTDGANTYGDLDNDAEDAAGNKSTYAAYGYVGHKFDASESATRLYRGTSDDVGKSTYTASNYQKALDEQMRKICDNAKGSNILMMTVALDLDATKPAEAKAISELTTCASDSRFRKGEDGKAKKLFWNATGATLSTVFKEIADELSNLRIVG